MDIKFPEIKKSIADLIADEEGSIPRTRLVTIGSTIMLLGMLLSADAYAAHRSHTSHTSHSSTSYHRSHVSHTSARDNSVHSSHASHESHANVHSSQPVHTNSNTGATHLNNAGGSIPGTTEIPVPQIPENNDFYSEISEVGAGTLSNLDLGKTKAPKLGEK